MQREDREKVEEIAIQFVKIQAEIAGIIDTIKLIRNNIGKSDELQRIIDKMEEIIDDFWAIRGRLNNLRR